MPEVSIETYLANLDKAITGLPDASKNAILKNQDEITDILAWEQLYKGKDGNNKTLGFYRADRLFPPSGSDGRGYPKRSGASFNFLDTGNFFNSLYVVAKAKYKYQIVSNVSYLDEIIARANSENLLKLNEENTIKVAEIERKEVDQWLSKFL